MTRVIRLLGVVLAVLRCLLGTWCVVGLRGAGWRGNRLLHRCLLRGVRNVPLAVRLLRLSMAAAELLLFARVIQNVLF